MLRRDDGTARRDASRKPRALTLSVVCSGAGWVTRNRHIPALKRDPRVTVLGVVDRHLDRAREVASAFDLPHAGVSLDEPWTADANSLTIGTPPLAHAELLRTAVERGWHCLCEKPFALPSEVAAQLAKKGQQSGLVLGVFHNFQFSRSGMKLFELVESGRLGQIEAVYAFQLSNPKRRLPTWYRSLPGGLFLDESPHLLYLMRRVLGSLEPRTVDARLAGREIRDLAVTFDHDSIWASLSMSFNASVSEWQFLVVGRQAVAALDLFRDLLVTVPNDETHRAREILRSSAAIVGGHLVGVASSGTRLLGRRLTYGNDEVVRRFVDATEGAADRLRWLGAEDGYAVVACIEDVLRRAGVDPAGSSAA
jgi:scyllo-inositol 2-dehydrogenase (NADP+)